MGTTRLWTSMLVLALAAGCSGANDPAATPAATSLDTVATEPWGQKAVAWFEAMEEAAANGPEHMANFLADDLVWEDRIYQQLAQGEESWLAAGIDLWETFLPRGGATFFVSADEVLSQRLVSYVDVPVSWLDRMVVGPDGVSYWSRAGSLEGGRRFQPGEGDYDMLDNLADRYVALWNGSGDVDAASVYVDDAVISDTLLNESVSGTVAISRSVGSGSWPSIGLISIADLPEGGGRAVHGVPSDEDSMTTRELGLVIEVDDGSGCPGSMAVVMGLDGERVSWERRYNDIMSIRRCYDPGTLQPGWWDGMQVPSTVFVEPTGVVSYGDMEVEIFNGAPELDPFVQWGFSRFETAGLPLPRVSSVTFLEAHAACYNLGGQALTQEEGAKIVLCRTSEDICLDEACEVWPAGSEQLWLHELAHPWLDEHTDEATRARFLDLVGLPRWGDHDDPWHERGVERAADALGFGLMDKPVELAPEFHSDCEERIAGFRILTGAEPIAACTPESGTSTQ